MPKPVTSPSKPRNHNRIANSLASYESVAALSVAAYVLNPKTNKSMYNERYIIDKQIEVIMQILAKKAYPDARTISIKKIEAELAELEKKAEEYATVNA